MKHATSVPKRNPGNIKIKGKGLSPLKNRLFVGYSMKSLKKMHYRKLFGKKRRIVK